MKIIFIIVGILFILFSAFQIYLTMSTNKTETQAYRLIKVEQEFEMRFYPSATMAIITSTSTSFQDLGSTGFGKLAKYIFGGNSESKQIAMTSPVHMDIGDSISTMAFVMPSKFNKEDLPKPNNSEIVIQTAAPEYVAVITFDGFANKKNIDEYTAMLKNALDEKGLTYYGNFRYLGYNPPFQLFGRRNEVIVGLNADQFNK